MTDDRSILGEREYQRVRRRFLLLRGVLGFGGLMFLVDHTNPSKIHPVQEIAYGILFAPLFGYLFGLFIWELEKEKILNQAVKRARGEATRIPITKMYFRQGLIMAPIGIAIMAMDICFFRTFREYLVPAIILGFLMTLQVALFYRYQEEEYLSLTTSPAPEITYKAGLHRYWPIFLILITAIFLSPSMIGGLSFLFLLLLHPFQRRLYLRSIREFGH